MFRGATLVNLDSKGRLTVPTRYRGMLSEESEGQMVLLSTFISHAYYFIHYLNGKLLKKLSQLSTMNPAERRVQRLLLGHASECQMDSAGRLLLANTLRQHAGLKKAVMLVGQINKFELWDEQTWYQQVQADIEAEQSANEPLSTRLQDLSL